MKGRTSAMLGHLIFGFLAGAFGISASFYKGTGITNTSIIPLMVVLPLLGLVGVLIFLGGIGLLVKKSQLYYVGLAGDILIIPLALTGGGFWVAFIGALLAITIYPEIKNNQHLAK